MFNPIQHNVELAYRQRKVRAEYIQAQRQVSLIGLRQILGNTFIEIGGRIHGMAQSSCMEAAETRGRVRGVLRTPDASVRASIIH